MTSREFRCIAARYRLSKMRLRKLANSGQEAFQFHDREGRSILVQRSTRVPGTWQMTWFCLEGLPAGHTESNTLAGALEDARQFGAIIVSERSHEELTDSLTCLGGK